MNQSAFRRCSLICSLLLLSFSTLSHAQKKANRRMVKQLQTDIGFLASDALEGRRTGSVGEKKAGDYLASWYEKKGIAPYGDAYRHPFSFVYGKESTEATEIRIGTQRMALSGQAFPLPFSANTPARVIGEILPDVLEQGNIWMINLYADEDEAQNPHFDYEKQMYEKAREAQKQGATAVIYYDGYGSKYPPQFNPHSDYETLDIPVVFVNDGIFNDYVRNRQAGVQVSINVSLKKTERTGTNIAAYIDNHAPYTVILGAHYDHLGYGEDGNSLDPKAKGSATLPATERTRYIHNGADDNASGTAGLLALAQKIKDGRLKHYNYLFLNFSGEELGLLGSKALVKELNMDSSKIAYMINMDMIGRLNDSTHALTVGGVGTSPVWGQFVSKTNQDFKIIIDSSGVGPSDHTSFYHAGIPVLFFFTGIHHDYHKPSDDADKINYFGEVQVLNYAYNIIKALDGKGKPAFTPTRQTTVGKVRFKVTLGIMPDYSYQEEGVRIDGVSDDRPAQKAGMKAGDIIVQMGELKIQGMQSYMEALGMFKVGDTTEVTVLREGKPLKMSVTF